MPYNNIENEVKSLIRCYYTDYICGDDSRLTNLRIHMVNSEIKDEIVNVTVWLGRPGLFIGKQGKDIGELEHFLEDKLERKVNIHIKEYDPFQIDHSLETDEAVRLEKLKMVI